jgi:hypothetical protein
MWTLRVLLILVFAATLSGCATSRFAGAEFPLAGTNSDDGLKSSSRHEPLGHKPRQTRTSTARDTTRPTADLSSTAGTRLERYSPEWWDQETAKDAKMKATTVICTGCLKPTPDSESVGSTEGRKATTGSPGQ